MRIAVFTPTHDVERLLTAARSMRVGMETARKEGVEVQWVVLRNGNARGAALDFLVTDWDMAGVTVVDAPESMDGKIGALKREACRIAIERNATHLVELDHDDELTRDALIALRDAFSVKGVGFVSSDTATPTRYGAEFGWKNHSAVVQGRRLWVNESSRIISSRSLYEIFHAPNHVRAWSVEAYKAAGGYDAALEVCDDHDLLCRTYLQGVHMVHLPVPLYLQSESEEQTQVKRNAEIQRVQAEVGARHLYALAAEEARRRGLRMVDLGGAHNPTKGYETLDLAEEADIKHDVREGLPFPDDSVGVLRAHDFLEHLAPGDVVPFMNECWRVLAPGGWLLTSTPSTDGRGAWQDPTHLSGWNSNSFWYYTQAEHAQYVPAIKCRFQLARIVNRFPSPFHELHLIRYVDAALWALKGQPEIGRVHI